MRISPFANILVLCVFTALGSTMGVLPIRLSAQGGIAPPPTATINQIIPLFAEAKLELAVTQCSELVFSDVEPMTRARAYAMLALAYHLQDLPDVADRIQNLEDLCADADNLDKAVLLPVLAYMGGRASADRMTAALSSATPDWQAFGILCRYVMTLRDTPDPRVLHELYKEYADATAIMSRSDWVAAWMGRVPVWQKCLQDKTSLTPMEPLVANRIPNPNQEAERAEQAQAARLKAFGAVNQVIELYLGNQVANAAKAARKPLPDLAALAPAEAASLGKILAYLAGDKATTSRDIFQSTQTDPQMWALACVAMFARDVAAAGDAAQLDPVILLNHLDNFHGNLSRIGADTPVATWEKRTRDWERWCTDKFAARPGLPPLLAARCGTGAATPRATTPEVAAAADTATYPAIASLTPELFAEGRAERYKDRPRPADLAFDANQLNRYIASLPPELREVEKKRAEIIARIKEHLVKIFARSPYRGDVKLRSRTRRGIISMANENILVFKSTERAKGQRIRWAELAPEQYVIFFEYFARQRQGMSGGQVTKEESNLNAANDYVGLALLCDWFGLYGPALAYAQKAVTLAPAIEPGTARLVLP
jgi:hypothetical protein